MTARETETAVTPPPAAAPADGRVHRFPCPGCGAKLEFDPLDGLLECPYCGRQEAIPAAAEQVRERSYEEYLRVRPERLEPTAASPPEVGCRGCGARVTLDPGITAGACPFCASPVVTEPGERHPWVAPESLLPFQVPRDGAGSRLGAWLTSRWFAPNALRRVRGHEALRGVYLPFWTFDAHTTTHYRGMRGDHHYEARPVFTRDARGRTIRRLRRVRRTRWRPAAGTVSRWFDDLLVAGTTSLPARRLRALGPWDLGGLRPYDAGFLAGFQAERYRIELPAAFEAAKQSMEAVIRGDVRRDIGGDVQTIASLRTSYTAITYKHLLLPVWVAAYRFRGRLYQVVINARTGEVQGDRPWSIWKIAGAVAVAALLAALLALLAPGS